MSQALKIGTVIRGPKIDHEIVRTGKKRYRNRMLGYRPFLMIMSLGAAFLAAACAAPEAYVFKVGEFNRASKTFGKEPEDLELVTICYNKMGTKSEIISKLAIEECGKYGKQAIFFEQRFDLCPLFTPIAAVYDCERDKPEEQKVSNPFNEYPNFGTKAPERIKP